MAGRWCNGDSNVTLIDERHQLKLSIALRRNIVCRNVFESLQKWRNWREKNQLCYSIWSVNVKRCAVKAMQQAFDHSREEGVWESRLPSGSQAVKWPFLSPEPTRWPDPQGHVALAAGPVAPKGSRARPKQPATAWPPLPSSAWSFIEAPALTYTSRPFWLAAGCRGRLLNVML